MSSAPSVETDEASRDFVVEDGTGVALVRVDSGVEVIAGSNAPVTADRVRSFLEAHGRAGELEGWEAKERVLGAGQSVAVFGVGEWEVSPHGSPARDGTAYRDAPRRLVVRAPAGLRILIGDCPEFRG